MMAQRKAIGLLVSRLEATNEQLHGTAAVLQHYIDSCSRAGLHGTARALQLAVGQLHLTGRMNQSTINEVKGHHHAIRNAAQEGAGRIIRPADSSRHAPAAPEGEDRGRSLGEPDEGGSAQAVQDEESLSRPGLSRVLSEGLT